MRRHFLLLIALLAMLRVDLSAQTPVAGQRERDLKYESTAPVAPTTANPVASPAAKPAIPRSYALVVGVARYRNLVESAQLQFPERDAESIYSILISREGGNFPAENVHKLIGAQATLASIRRELETWLPAVTAEGDRVLIYFAGHGFVHDGAAYLAPFDLDPSRIAATGYPMAKLGQQIGGPIKGKWKVLLTDACHSGSITPEDARAQINRGLQQLDRSLFSLTASRDRELSFESPELEGGHGVFTYFVVKGLQGAADENRDGVVTADELADYVRRNVREATKNQQTPTSDKASFDPRMLLAFDPTGVAPGQPPPPKNGTLIVSVNQDGVEVFVDEKPLGVVSKATPLRVEGLVPGIHLVKGVKMGYEPDGPREENIYPGRETTVQMRVQIPRHRTKAAVEPFERGLRFYRDGGEDNYRRAADAFTKALGEDPKYSQAALYLARSRDALYDEAAARAAYQRALAIDPDFTEARASFGGMLLNSGDYDESIRQLNAVVQRDPAHAVAWYLLALAFRYRGAYPESIEAAHKSIALVATNPEPHLWLADSLRLNQQYAESLPSYDRYLELSDFDSKLAGKLNYYLAGSLLGTGHKRRAAQSDIWRELRSMAYFGKCNSEYKLGRLDVAASDCGRALGYRGNDPQTHYLLALCLMRDAIKNNSKETLSTARLHFQSVVELNPDLEEAGFSKRNIQQIDAALR